MINAFKGQRGFTLFELLLVLILITLMSTLGLGIFQKNSETFKQQRLVAEIQHFMEQARQLAMSENREIAVVFADHEHPVEQDRLRKLGIFAWNAQENKMESLNRWHELTEGYYFHQGSEPVGFLKQSTWRSEHETDVKGRFTWSPELPSRSYPYVLFHPIGSLSVRSQSGQVNDSGLERVSDSTFWITKGKMLSSGLHQEGGKGMELKWYRSTGKLRWIKMF